MSQRFLRHNIVGSEAHRPRPMAYLRRGGTRRRPRAWARRALPGLLLAGALVLGIGARLLGGP